MVKGEPYKITLMNNLLPYLRYQKETGYRKSLFEFTESGYPKIFCIGWCSHARREIVILKKGKWYLRLLHEIGHELGLSHAHDRKHIMYPYFFRGDEGYHDVEIKYDEKYGQGHINDLSRKNK